MSFYEYPHTRTYDSDLGWLIKHVTNYDETIQALNNWIAEYTPKIEEILALLKAFEDGDIPEGIKNAIYDWCQVNLLDLVARTLKTVIFGLTDDGHFLAIYTDSWSDIIFNTTEYDIWTAINTEYGHLTLSLEGGI